MNLKKRQLKKPVKLFLLGTILINSVLLYDMIINNYITLLILAIYYNIIATSILYLDNAK